MKKVNYKLAMLNLQTKQKYAKICTGWTTPELDEIAVNKHKDGYFNFTDVPSGWNVWRDKHSKTYEKAISAYLQSNIPELLKAKKNNDQYIQLVKDIQEMRVEN